MKCPGCKIREKKKHFNAKWCAPCANVRRKKPIGKLTREQERKVRKLAGTMFRHDLADYVGVSRSSLNRWLRDHPEVNANHLAYKPEVIEKVIDYYVKHGKIKTQKKFPDVKVRSIVERYAHQPRQIRWENSQLIELAKMGGLVSSKKQANYFNRPNASAGSIKSAWMKKFGHSSVNINGLSYSVARHYIKKSCPIYETSFYCRTKGFRKIALWIDVAAHLKSDVPEHLRTAILALAKFQKWLHGKNYKTSIKKILEMSDD